MRILLGTVALMLYVGNLSSQPPQFGLNAPVPGLRVPVSPTPCDAHAIAQQIAIATRARLGFEDLPACTTETYPGKVWLANRIWTVGTQETVGVADMSAREALNWLTKAIPAFAWRDMDGIAIVRPTEAWSSSKDLLNSRVPSLHTTVNLSESINRLFFGSRLTSTGGGRTFALSFDGGSVVDALNTILSSAPGTEWDATIIEHPTNWHASDPVAVVGVRLALQGEFTNFDVTANSLTQRH
jgi:hypothetical protein